jgi:hypothetical protein
MSIVEIERELSAADVAIDALRSGVSPNRTGDWRTATRAIETARSMAKQARVRADEQAAIYRIVIITCEALTRELAGVLP